MGDVQLDVAQFHKRASALLRAWKNATDNEDFSTLNDVDAVLVIVGAANDEAVYQKSSALHTWLLGYEFPSTLMLLAPDHITFLTSGSKAKLLEPLKGGKVPVTILQRGKDEAANQQLSKQVIKEIEKSGQGKRVGIFPKDNFQGKFMDEWKAFWQKAKSASNFDEVDVASAFSGVWGPKDEEEMKYARTAAKMSSAIMSDYFVDEMTGILDDGRKVTHEKLSAMVEEKLEDKKLWRRAKGLPNDLDLNQADWAYTPIVQSGGEYDLRTSAQSTSKRLEGAQGGGVVVASMGIKYRGYCANVGRTFLIDPAKSQEKTYAFLLELQRKIVEEYLRDGVVGRDVYNKAVEFVRAKDPALADSMTKNVGFATGMEFRDASYLLGPKCTRKFRAGMAVNLVTGFQDLPDPNRSGKTYSLLLIDTVRVNKDESASYLTDRVKTTGDFQFFFKDEEDEKAKEEKDRSKSPVKPKPQVNGRVTATGKVLRNKTRGKGGNPDDNVAKRIKEHQKELHRQKHEEGLARYAGQDGEGTSDKGRSFKRFESYKREVQLPSRVGDGKILVDSRANSIILPIYGYAVPFHINTLKNASKSDEGEYSYLRLNFISPGQIAGKKEDLPFDDPNATFVRSMSYRSMDAAHIAEVYREITDLKKGVAKREAEKKELADVIEQDKLQISARRPLKLSEVFIRPAPDTKRMSGDLEIHMNGLRYTSPMRDGKVDVLFNNIKHLVFQPCDNELIVIIHIHLKAPIIVGKKKTKDIQFYREAGDVQFDETGNRKRKFRYGDEDEIELEQEEKRRKSQLNKEFQSFADKISDAADNRFEVDIPFRELAFNGVPFRTNVLLQPATDCLVQLTELPFTVVTLSEVELVHMERVVFGLKNFDLVFVFSDFTKPPVHINAIPMSSLDSVKEWLDSVDIAMSEGNVNLNWPQIMKTVNDDPHGFFEEGGWSFLQSGSDGEDSETAEESGSEFEDSDAFEDESSEDSESSFDEHASDDEGSASEFDDEEGEDWDELEREAAKSDEKKRMEKGDSDDDGQKSRSKAKPKRR